MEAGRGEAGSRLDASLAEEGFLKKVTEHAVRAVLVWQIDQEMKAQYRTKAATAGWIPARLRRRLARSRRQRAIFR